MKNPLKIPAGKVKETGKLRLEERVAAEEFAGCLGDTGRLVGPVDVALDLFARSEQVGMRGLVSGEWELECGRCLAKTKSAYSASVEAVLEASGSVIDVAEEVRQALVLALPARMVCRPDCKGLCPSCRKDRNQGDCGCKVAAV